MSSGTGKRQWGKGLGGVSSLDKQVALFYNKKNNKKKKLLLKSRDVTAGCLHFAVLWVLGMVKKLFCCLHIAHGATDAGVSPGKVKQNYYYYFYFERSGLLSQ